MSDKGMPKRRVITGLTKFYLKVPLERIGVLIGSGGKVIKELMNRTNTIITVDSANGTVIIEPSSSATSPLNLLKAQDFIKAISVGFSPERAWRVLDEEQVLIVLDLKQYVGPSQSHLTRIKGRIIGEEGKARKNIEQMTGTYISVYEDYVGIIGDYESANVAKEAIEMLIQGRQHSTVYRYIDRAMREIKRRSMTQLWRRF
ncbi:MAG: RNA-processing protein [Thermoprotei archaeon]|nr:MAG: RNA-processing protein [Thermoprotei archaeon]